MSSGMQKEKKKSRRKKRAEKRDNGNDCIVCFSRVAESERFRPCNCTFGFVHRQCIKDWINVGRNRCRICSHLYDANRRNDVCFVCSKQCDRQFFPCACKHIVVHQQCLNKQYASGQQSCRFCGSSYNIKVRNQFVCTAARCHCFRFKFILYFFWALFYLAVFVFLAAPSDFASLIDSQPRRKFVSAGSSVFLFPGNPTSNLYFADLLYCIAVGASIVLFVIGACLRLWEDCCLPDNRRAFDHSWSLTVWLRNAPQWKLQLVPILIGLFILLLHLFGNAHYQIYCAAGIIPSENCFWMINWASFVTSIAGILLLFGPLALLAGFLLFLKWLFVKKQQKVVVLSAVRV